MANDLEALHGALCRLRGGLIFHIAAEQDAVVDLPPVAGRVILRGQQRLVGLIDQLLGAADSDDGGWECLVRSAELARQFTRQARLEIDLLRRRERVPDFATSRPLSAGGDAER